jgi:hypothetical protein
MHTDEADCILSDSIIGLPLRKTLRALGPGLLETAIVSAGNSGAPTLPPVMVEVIVAPELARPVRLAFQRRVSEFRREN